MLDWMGRGQGEASPMNTIPNCHLPFIGVTVGLLRTVVRLAVRRTNLPEWRLVPINPAPRR